MNISHSPMISREASTVINSPPTKYYTSSRLWLFLAFTIPSVSLGKEGALQVSMAAVVNFLVFKKSRYTDNIKQTKQTKQNKTQN